MSNFILGLDLGQAADYTAIAIIECFQGNDMPKNYHIRHLERCNLGTSYPNIVNKVKDMVERAPLLDSCSLVVDATGVGKPVVDMFQESRIKAPLYPVSIHGGDAVSKNGSAFGVPKRDLVGVLQVLFQSKRLVIAEDLPDAATLVQELLNFRAKISATGHDSYEAWREGVHDDLVLAVALACWYAETQHYSISFLSTGEKLESVGLGESFTGTRSGGVTSNGWGTLVGGNDFNGF